MNSNCFNFEKLHFFVKNDICLSGMTSFCWKLLPNCLFPNSGGPKAIGFSERVQKHTEFYDGGILVNLE